MTLKQCREQTHEDFLLVAELRRQILALHPIRVEHRAWLAISDFVLFRDFLNNLHQMKSLGGTRSETMDGIARCGYGIHDLPGFTPHVNQRVKWVLRVARVHLGAHERKYQNGAHGHLSSVATVVSQS